MGIGETIFGILQPSNSLALLLALGALLLLLRRRRTGTALVILATLGILALGFLPIGNAALRVLEARTAPGVIDAPPDGIIVLGGYHPKGFHVDPLHVPLNEMAERLTAGVALAKRYPDAKLIFTDGSEPMSGAEMSEMLAVSLGVPRSQIVADKNALSTWDNARFTRELVDPQPGQRYVLVTSAWHMPRSLATFRTAGWTGLIPFPVDYVTDERPAWRAWNHSVAEGLSLADLAAREYLATAFYFAKGRIGSLLPDARS